MEDKIELDGNLFPYRIEYKNTRIFKLRVKDGVICIVAPYRSSLKQIQNLMIKHKEYLKKAYQQNLTIQKKEQIQEFDKLTILGKTYEVVFTHTSSKISNHYLFLKKQEPKLLLKEIKQ